MYGQALRPDAAEPSELVTLTKMQHVHRVALRPVWDVAPHGEATGDEARVRSGGLTLPGRHDPAVVRPGRRGVHGCLERTRGVWQTDGHLIECLADSTPSSSASGWVRTLLTPAGLSPLDLTEGRTRMRDNQNHNAPGCSWWCGPDQHSCRSEGMSTGLRRLSEAACGRALRGFCPTFAP